MAVTRIRSAPVVDYSWQSQAACRDTAPELFLGPDEERPRDRVRRESLAVKLCMACPVRRDCLDHALRIPERHGVWGATTPEQRTAINPPDLEDLGWPGLC